jgi:hypothetical protein
MLANWQRIENALSLFEGIRLLFKRMHYMYVYTVRLVFRTRVTKLLLALMVIAVVPHTQCATCTGMTWAKDKHDNYLGIDSVG